MNDRRSEGRDTGAVPRDLPDQQATGTDEDHWEAAVPEEPEAPVHDDGHGHRDAEPRDDEPAPQEPAD
jgi:hypothetical protein